MEDINGLIKRAGGGDTNAFRELVSSVEGKLYALALRMLKNKEDAEDCLQDALIRIYKSLDGFKGESSFSTWAYRITMNTCLDELRRRKQKQSQSLDVLMDSGFSPADTADSPEASMVKKTQMQVLNKAIGDLPKEMRAAIILRDIEGMSYEDIADQLGINVGTVKSRISRGREKLREVIMQNSELFGRGSVNNK